MTKKVFITGGTGFVGQNIIPELLNNGYEVFALARSEKSAQKLLKNGATPVYDDLLNLTENTAKALSKCDFIVHSAAYMDFNYEKDMFYNMNVNATQRLLHLAKENGVKRFLYISAAPVVGGSPVVNVSEATADKSLPTDLYPKTKALTERKVLSANSSEMSTISIRPPAIWGVNNHHMEEVFDRVKAGQWRWIGGSHQILSTIHVKNLAAAVLVGLDSDKSDAYFVTDDDRRSMRTTFSALFEANGLDGGDKEIPLALAANLARVFDFIWKLFGLKSRPPVPPLAIRLMAREFSVSDAKARKELGYRSVISFKKGIEEIRSMQ